MSRARDGNSLSPIQVFDLGCAESRVRELTDLFIGEFAIEHMRELAMKQKRAFEAVTPYPYDTTQQREMFYERARTEALKILEQEKKNVADFRSPHIQLILKTYLKQLKYVLLDDGKPFKTCPEESWCPDYTGTSMQKVVTNYSRSQLIDRWEGNLAGEKDFRPYLNVELQALWNEADALASQEHLVSKPELKSIEKASKTEKEVQEAT